MHAEARFWDELAERYAAQPVENPQAFDNKIAITKALMSPEDVVLDVGCGTGSLCLRLADAGRELHGLDFSAEMVRIARGKAQGLEHVRFHQGTIDEAPFEDGSLDGVMAWSLLHLVPDRAAFLAKAFELTRPGGFFVSSTVVLGESWVPMLPMIAVMRWFGKAPWVGKVSVEELSADIRAAGFVELEVHEVGAKKTTCFLTARKPA